MMCYLDYSRIFTSLPSSLLDGRVPFTSSLGQCLHTIRQLCGQFLSSILSIIAVSVLCAYTCKCHHSYALSCIILLCLYIVGEVEFCNLYEAQLWMLEAFIAISLPCNAWMFLQRIRALPSHYCPKLAVLICTVLWVSTFTSFLVFPGFRTTSVSVGSEWCYETGVYHSRLLSAPIIAILVFDSATMIVVLVGFANHSQAQSWTGKIRSLFTIEDMGYTSAVFLRSGQVYYV